jgi:hypothetical protein
MQGRLRRILNAVQGSSVESNLQHEHRSSRSSTYCRHRREESRSSAKPFHFPYGSASKEIISGGLRSYCKNVGPWGSYGGHSIDWHTAEGSPDPNRFQRIVSEMVFVAT